MFFYLGKAEIEKGMTENFQFNFDRKQQGDCDSISPRGKFDEAPAGLRGRHSASHRIQSNLK